MLKHLQASEDWNEKSLGAKGFTLIELLVVIVILGILAAVVVFAVSGIKDRGDKSACQTDKRTLLTAIEAWNASPRADDTLAKFPADQDDLVAAEFLQAPSTMYTFSGDGTDRPEVEPIDPGKCTDWP